MTRNLYILLGLADGAAFSDVKKQYFRLTALFFEQDERCEGRLLSRLRMARERLSLTYEEFKTADISKAYNGYFKQKQTLGHREIQPSQRPKLGQLLVAAGVITIEQLDETLSVQRMSETGIPIGRILVSWCYLTENELDYYLKLQELIKLPPSHPNRFAGQLLELGLITCDQAAIAGLDQRSKGISFGQALVNRGWLTQPLTERIPVATDNLATTA